MQALRRFLSDGCSFETDRHLMLIEELEYWKPLSHSLKQSDRCYFILILYHRADFLTDLTTQIIHLQVAKITPKYVNKINKNKVRLGYDLIDIRRERMCGSNVY